MLRGATKDDRASAIEKALGRIEWSSGIGLLTGSDWNVASVGWPLRLGETLT